MEESKLFKRLWRFNAVVIAAAGVFALISAFGVIGMLVYEFTGSRHNNEIVTVDSDTEVKESFRLGQIQHLNGSDAVLVPLYGNQSFRAMYSSGKKSHSIRSLLFNKAGKGYIAYINLSDFSVKKEIALPDVVK